MKKQAIALAMAALMAASMTACSGGSKTETTAAATEAATTAAATETTEAASSEAETEAAGGTLVMVTNAEFPPYVYHDGGEIVGIDVEICDAIAAKLGKTMEIEDVAFDSLIPEVVSGKADIGAGGITVTEDRKKNVDFSDVYTTASQVIIVKDGSDIAGPDDLKGKAIGVQLGTTGDLYALIMRRMVLR